MSQGQAKFPGIVREAESGSVVTVTRHDTPVAYLLGRERMEAIVETMEILADHEAMKAIRDYEAGRTEFGKLSDLA